MRHSSRMKTGGSNPTPPLKENMITKRQEEFLNVLRTSLGVVGLALQKTEVSREEYEDWKDDLEFKLILDEIEETSLDYVENQLLMQIRDGNLNAITYYLKTKGKNRGY